MIGLNVEITKGHIVSVQANSTDKLVRLGHKLRALGLFIGVVRYPTVPIDRPTLRISIHSGHRKKDIDRLVSELQRHKGIFL